MDAGLVAAEFGEALQIRDNALSVDGSAYLHILSAAVAIRRRLA